MVVACASQTALLFTAIVTFVEVAFVDGSGEVDGLFIINRVVDLVFLLDLGLQFFLMYAYQGNNPADSVRWIYDPVKIRRQYLRGWFALDAFSIGVSGFDFLALKAVSGEDGGGANLKVFRMIRMARLIKLVRLVRSSRILKRFETRMAINYGTLSLIKIGVGLLISSHWTACIWGLQTQWESPRDTWYVLKGYCVFVPPPDFAFYADQHVAGNLTATALYNEVLGNVVHYQCDEAMRRYIASLYWAMMTITSIGYGDIAATPGNALEQSVGVVLMLSGGMIWGTVIAVFCGVLANMDPKGTEFKRTMDDLNSFMSEQGLPPEMRPKLREYFHQTRHLQVARANKTLISMMSPMLQGKVVWEINQRWLKHVWFLRNAEDTFMVKLALALTAAVFAPSELCPNGYMYISHRGIVLYGGRVLTSGKVWGEDMILSSPALRSKYAARCMTYVEVYVISRDELLDLAKQFPATLRIVRRSSFRLAFRREMIRRAQENLNAVRKFDPTSATSPTMVRSIKRATAVPASLDTASNRMLMAVSSQSSFSEDDDDELETVNMASPMGTGDATLNHEALQAFDTNMLQEHRRLLAQVQEISSQLKRLDEKRIIISAGHRARTAG
jgi:CRP-like cAMP-binding protein